MPPQTAAATVATLATNLGGADEKGEVALMKIVKDALWRLWRLIRTTSLVVGLAVMIALVAGVVSLAVAKPTGGTSSSVLLLGAQNTADAVTTLINSGTGAALNLQVQTDNPPLAVNSDTKVDKLNADLIDGREPPMWAVVEENGNLASSSEGDITSKLVTFLPPPNAEVSSYYLVDFGKDVSQCAISATLAKDYILPRTISTATYGNSDLVEQKSSVQVVGRQLTDTDFNIRFTRFSLVANC